MRDRWIAGMLVVAIGLLTAAVPCAAMLTAPERAAHDCCDHSEKPQPQQKTSCELLCALGDLPATPADPATLQIEPIDLELGRLASDAAPSGLTAPDSIDLLVPPTHGPPLFVVHSAFLI